MPINVKYFMGDKKTENVVHMLRKDDIHRNLNKMQSRALCLVAQVVSVMT